MTTCLTTGADEDGDPTTDEPTEDDLYDEFDQIRKKLKIKSWEGKFVKRKYVFDDCEPGSDPEQQYLKVIYGFNGTRVSTTSNPSQKLSVPRAQTTG